MAIIERCRELAGRRGGIDVAFGCSGAPETLRTFFETVRHEAAVITVGHPGRLELDWLITHRMKLSQIHDAVELLTRDACKVLPAHVAGQYT